MKLTLLIFFLLFQSCSSVTTHLPKEKVDQDTTVFTDFSSNKNYKLTFDFNYPIAQGQTKHGANIKRKAALKNYIVKVLHFIYGLPQEQVYNDENEYKLCKAYKQTRRNIKCTDGPQGGRGRSISISTQKYLDEVSKTIPQELIPYETRFIETLGGSSDFINKKHHNSSFLLTESSGFTAKLSGTIHSNTYSQFGDNLIKNYSQFRKVYLRHEYLSGRRVFEVANNNQYLAVANNYSKIIPVTFANKKLIDFTHKYTFPLTTKKEFQPLKNRIFKIMKDTSLDQDITPVHVLKSQLFFGEWGYFETFNSIKQTEFEKFLKDIKLRQRLYGLYLLSYTDLKIIKIDKHKVQVVANINIKDFFKDIKFEEVSNHFE